MDALTGAIPSPCTGLCRIGADEHCEGCRRTLAEIAAWPSMTDAARRSLVAALALRRPAST